MEKEGTADNQFRSLQSGHIQSDHIHSGYKTEQNVLSVDEICLNTWKEVYRFIYYRVGNREEAEDITQETYAKALEFLQREQVVIDNYSNFFKTVAINILRDQWRQKKRRGTQMDMDDINNIEVAEAEDFTENSAKREIIEAAMSSLNAEQRRVIELRIFKGYTAAETAKIIRKKEATVRVIQYRALKALAVVLKEWY